MISKLLVIIFSVMAGHCFGGNNISRFEIEIVNKDELKTSSAEEWFERFRRKNQKLGEQFQILTEKMASNGKYGGFKLREVTLFDFSRNNLRHNPEMIGNRKRDALIGVQVEYHQGATDGGVIIESGGFYLFHKKAIIYFSLSSDSDVTKELMARASVEYLGFGQDLIVPSYSDFLKLLDEKSENDKSSKSSGRGGVGPHY